MLTDEEATRVVGATLMSSDGQEVGEVESVLTHAADNRAAWGLVEVDERRVLVPLDQAGQREQDSSRDPRGGGGANDAAQGHP